MSVHLGILYHWSPKGRRRLILQHGLQLLAPPTVSTAALPWICLGTTPSSAWGLTLAEDDEIWDLWQVSLRDTDHVEVLPTWGPMLREVRVHNGLPADRVWWVGERDCHAGIALQRRQRAGHGAGAKPRKSMAGKEK